MKLKNWLKAATLPAAAALLVACGGDSEPEAPAGSADAGGPATGGQPPAQQAAGKSGSDVPATPKLTYKCPKDQLTLVDICLGMPVNQVKAALLQHDPEIQIEERQTTFDYSDGAQTMRTDPFVSRIRAEIEAKDDYFQFNFTAPPGEGRLIRMTRTLGGSGANLPALVPFMKALEDRYGEPDFQQRSQRGAMTAVMRWDFPEGRVLCADQPEQNQGMVSSRTGAVRFGNNLDIIMGYLGELGVDDPARCTRWLQANIQTFAEDEPVRSVQMEMTDFALEFEKGKATNAWLTKMEAEARAARLENAQMPDL